MVSDTRLLDSPPLFNHATHHRSEAASMMTMISGSPPDTGINAYRTVVVKG